MGKRKVTLIYGEKTVQVNFRIPESKRDIIEKEIYGLLEKYQNVQRVEIDVKNQSSVIAGWDSKLVRDLDKKIEPQVVVDIAARVVEKKVVDMDALRAIASGINLSDSFVKKKVNIDQEYDFEICKSIPVGDDAIYLDKQGLACYNRYDLGIYYVKWENRYLKFLDKKEFDRFSKEYLKF
jgi:hypothetical protein